MSLSTRMDFSVRTGLLPQWRFRSHQPHLLRDLLYHPCHRDRLSTIASRADGPTTRIPDSPIRESFGCRPAAANTTEALSCPTFALYNIINRDSSTGLEADHCSPPSNGVLRLTISLSVSADTRLTTSALPPSTTNTLISSDSLFSGMLTTVLCP